MRNTVKAGWVLPRELRNLDQKSAGELIENFKRETAEFLDLLRAAVFARDVAQVGVSARAIRERGSEVGAVELVITCRHMELDAAHNVTANLKRLLKEAEAEFRMLLLDMRA